MLERHRRRVASAHHKDRSSVKACVQFLSGLKLKVELFLVYQK